MLHIARRQIDLRRIDFDPLRGAGGQQQQSADIAGRQDGEASDLPQRLSGVFSEREHHTFILLDYFEPHETTSQENRFILNRSNAFEAEVVLAAQRGILISYYLQYATFRLSNKRHSTGA